MLWAVLLVAPSCGPHAPSSAPHTGDPAAATAPAIGAADAPDASADETAARQDDRSRIVKLGRGIEVDRSAGSVTLPARVAINEGWLEQAACSPNTREHESLLVVEAPPSSVHAALLLAGLQPGSPGAVRMIGQGDATSIERISPSGARVEIWVRRADGDLPLTAWMQDSEGNAPANPQPWVFAGSRIRPNTRSMGPGEHYVADYTGSLVGIVTLGDETIAFEEARSDQSEVEPQQWQARTQAMPAPGTPVLLVIRRAAQAPHGGP